MCRRRGTWKELFLIRHKERKGLLNPFFLSYRTQPNQRDSIVSRPNKAFRPVLFLFGDSNVSEKDFGALGLKLNLSPGSR